MRRARVLTIGELGKTTGTEVETICCYSATLSGSACWTRRAAGNYRIHANEHVRDLTFIRRARELHDTLTSCGGGRVADSRVVQALTTDRKQSRTADVA